MGGESLGEGSGRQPKDPSWKKTLQSSALSLPGPEDSILKFKNQRTRNGALAWLSPTAQPHSGQSGHQQPALRLRVKPAKRLREGEEG